MKNSLRLIKILSSFMLILCTFLSCTLEFEAENKLPAPTCDADAGNCISFSIQKYNSDTKYINIYRKDITNSSSKEFVNIGILYPENLVGEERVNQYKDFLVKKGHTYVYYARIYDGKQYIKTQNSNEVTIPTNANCFSDDVDFSYDVSLANFEYNKDDYTIRVNGDIYLSANIPNVNDYKPVLIVSSSKKTETFALPEKMLNSTETVTIALRGILSDDFFDTYITIEGICGQKIEYDDSNKSIPEENRPIKKISWTEPSKITLQGSENKNKIYVPDSSNNHGFDYSRKVEERF